MKKLTLAVLFICAHLAAQEAAKQRTWGDWAWGVLGYQVQTPEQKAWRVTSAHLRPYRETFSYDRIFQPHKEALENANKAFREAKIYHYVPLRTTYEGAGEAVEGRLRAGTIAASTNDEAIYLAPVTLKHFASSDELERLLAEITALHEHEHWIKGHMGTYRALKAYAASTGQESAYVEAFDRGRRYEYEADLASYRGLSTAKLLRQKYVFENGLFQGAAVFHPTTSEQLMMVNEELAARKTGKRPATTELPSWKSFSARNGKI